MLDVCLGFLELASVLHILQCEHVLEDHYLEPASLVLVVPIKLLFGVLVSQYLVDLRLLLAFSGNVLFFLLVEMGSLYLNNISRFELSLVKHVDGQINTFLLGIRDNGVTFELPVIILVHLYLLFLSLRIDPQNTSLRHKLLDLLLCGI